MLSALPGEAYRMRQRPEVPSTEVRYGVLCLFRRWAAKVDEDDDGSGFALRSEREKIWSVSKRAASEISNVVWLLVEV